MTKESLQNKCNEKDLKVKILHVKKTEYKDYEVIYTFDLNYQGRNYCENIDSIVEPELDELVEDENEFIFMAKINFEKALKERDTNAN